MQCRIRLVDLVTAGDPVRPNVAELIEVIDPPASDQDDVVNVRRRLQKSRDLFDAIANPRWPEQDERTFLFGVYKTIEKSVGKREPGSRTNVVLIIELHPAKQRAGRT